jgi:hypothetical protein
MMARTVNTLPISRLLLQSAITAIANIPYPADSVVMTVRHPRAHRLMRA